MPYKLTTGLMMSNSYEFIPCSQEYLSTFLKSESQNWYDQPICYKDRDAVTVKNNWSMDEYDVPMIALVYCKNSTANDNWCHTHDEIDAFLLEHSYYFAV